MDKYEPYINTEGKLTFLPWHVTSNLALLSHWDREFTSKHQMPTLKVNAMDVEMDQIKEYGVFKDCGKAKWEGKAITDAPSGYQKIRVHFDFAVKHCKKFKGRLVADGHLIKDPMESVYSGVVSLRGLRLVMFLAALNKLLLW